LKTPTTAELPHFHVVVVGLGFVGLTLGVKFASAGLKVLGVEKNPLTLESLKRGRAHFFEPGLDELLTSLQSEGTLSLSSSLDDLYTPRNPVHFVISVGTPLSDLGNKNDSFTAALKSISGCLIDGDLIITRSTVRVGTNRNLIPQILQSVNVNYGIASCPERTIEGAALKELEELPQIVSGLNEYSADKAEQLFLRITKKVVRVSSLEAAELLKLLANTYRDTLFAIANEYALIADSFGVSLSEIVEAAGADYPRFKLSRPGPVGGPCLEKDSYILQDSLENSDLSRLTISARERNKNFIEDYFLSLNLNYQKMERVLICGLAFKGKPETDDLRGSPVFDILGLLEKFISNKSITIWDPLIEFLPSELSQYPWWDIENSAVFNLVIIQNNHNFFSTTRFKTLLTSILTEDTVIVDLVGLNFFKDLPCRYVAPGEGFK
jgi:nucleotide sugar dehydrogenase